MSGFPRLDLQVLPTEPDATSRLSADAAKALMAQRARRLAEPPPDAASALDTVPVVTFTLGTEQYAVEARYVCEVLAVPDIMPLCGTRAFVLGLSNLRGELIAMVDLRQLMGMPPAKSPRRALVLGRDGAQLGLVTESGCDLDSLTPRDLDELTPPVEAMGRAYLRGVTKDGVIVLDGSALLDDPGLLVEEQDERVVRPRIEASS